MQYDALPAKRPKVNVTKEEIQAELERLQREHSTMEPPKSPRAAAKGDQVSIDFTIEVDGKLVDDAGANDFPAELGAGVLLPPIEEALLGKQVGDGAEANVEMAATHPHPKLKGKTATFKLTIKDLKERVLPALDDEFAKDLGDFTTLADLEKDVTARLEKVSKESSDNAVAEQLVVELVKANPIPLPPSLVERQMQLTEQEILSQARRQGQSVSGVGDDLRQKILADSEVKVRAGLLMAEIAKKEGIKIGDAEIEEGLDRAGRAERQERGQAPGRVSRTPRSREMLIGMILENKVLDIIEAKAKIGEEG